MDRRTIKAKFLIDEDMGLVDESFYEAAKKIGYDCEIYSGKEILESIAPLNDRLYFIKKWSLADCVVHLGSLYNNHRISSFNQGWIPFSYSNLETLKCSNYYPAINYASEVLLNRHYFLLPFKDISTQLELIKRLFCSFNDRIFIRPDKANKVFSGQTIDIEDIELELSILQQTYKIDDNELCLISSNKKELIDFEYRFVVVDGKVVAGSQYLPEERQLDYRHPAFTFAKDHSKLYCPDNAFTLDVCQLKTGDYKIIELNGFSSAGLYKCNAMEVVRAVARQARKDFFEIYTK